MEKQKHQIIPSQRDNAPQVKIRTGVTAGASLENCLQNLDYWRKQYYKMCGHY